MVTVHSVTPDSLAHKAGIRSGDILISVNGNDVRDVLDYRYYITEKKLTLLLHRGPELVTVKIKKKEYDDIGLEFETYLMDKKQTCRNKCIFCFIDQNPHGMRETIYFKDDDSRLSFLLGNYITLTNLTDGDIDRIIKMRLSPVNISVHTTNPTLRCQMMNNRFAGEVLRYLDRLDKAGIVINAQIVLCKGVNDGAELDSTLKDLAKYENIGSVAVVPSGLTKHREGLYPLSPFTKEEAAAVLGQVNAFGDKMLKKRGTRLVFPSDEFYLKAEEPIPDEDYYEDYPQLENGVGMIASMLGEFTAELPYVAEDYDPTKKVRCSVATGYAAYGFIKSLTEKLSQQMPNFRCTVYPIENRFFGEEITVAGLLCGCDLKEQLKDKPLGDFLALPSVMLRDEGDRFLDDTTLADLQKTLGVPIRLSLSTGEDFIRTLLGKPADN